MSKFFAGGDSSSESSSDEEELYSEEEEEKPTGAAEESSEEDSDEDEDDDSEEDSDDEGAGKTGASRFLRGDSSDSEDSDEERVKTVKSAKDKRFGELEAIIKAIDNGRKINDWGSISSEFDKLNRQAAKIGEGKQIPKIYIKTLAELEDFMNETIAKQKVTPKKMNATNARGLNAVKQKVKKITKDYQGQVDNFRKDEDAFMESEDEIPEPKIKKSKPTDLYLDETTAAEAANDEGFAAVGKGGKILQFTPESILKHLRGILESRGKKNTDRLEQIKIMEKLLEVANTPYLSLRVLLTLVSARFDLSAGSTTSTMPLDQWKAAEKDLQTLFEILEKNKDHIVIEGADEWEDDDKPPTVGEDEKYLKVPGSIVSYVERLDDELTRSLQSIDPHTSEYIERLSDEGNLYNTIFQGMLYYEHLQKDSSLQIPQDSVNRIVMRRLEHVYFKPAQVVKILEENAWKNAPADAESAVTPRSTDADATSLLNVLCNYLFTNSEGIIRARAMLCQIYFLALHDEYYKARDMMLMSHLQESINNFDVLTQILYNRTLVQVGLCAFRKGLVYDAQNTLQEICGSGRQKELLAQGVMIQRYSQVSPEQERLEKQRQLPFHMHINLELLECVYLTCSMLLEIPLLAQTGSSPDIKKRVISKTYRRMLEYHERQIFTGPPENTRDHVMQASRALAAGEWKKSINFVHSIKIWDLMPDTEGIKTMLSKQIQEEGLRTYLFTYAPPSTTLCPKMISHEELAAALDQVSATVIFRKGVELSRLQSLALTLSDKAAALIETNERTLEQRTQGTANAFDRRGQNQRGGHRGGRGGRGGGRGGGGNTGPRQAGGTQFTGGALGAANETISQSHFPVVAFVVSCSLHLYALIATATTPTAPAPPVSPAAILHRRFHGAQRGTDQSPDVPGYSHLRFDVSQSREIATTSLRHVFLLSTPAGATDLLGAAAAAEAPASSTCAANPTKKEAEEVATKLPPLSAAEFRVYNRMAEHMDMFHAHFRQSWNLLWNAATAGKRPAGMSMRSFILEGLQFLQYLTVHHDIEERHIFPVLAKKMPEFKTGKGNGAAELLKQHRDIHKGMEMLEEYLTACRSGESDLDMRVLKTKLETWADVLWTHLDQEVKTLGAENMRKYWTQDEMKRLPM
ncbi:eukaryotic translation initiation factor 3 subunit C [Apiospora saccharicola]